jgi:hypothetical protein
MLAELIPERERPDDAVCACVTVADLDGHGPGRLSVWLSADEGKGLGLLG